MRTLHNLFWKTAGEVVQRLLSTAFIIFLARELGTSEFGRYSTAFAWASVLGLFVDLGMNSVATREIARHPEKRSTILGTSIAIKLGISLVTWIAIHALAPFFFVETLDQRLVDAVGVVVVAYVLSEFFCALLAGKEEMDAEAGLKLVMRACSLGPGFYMLWRHAPLNTIVAAVAWGSLLSIGAGLLYVKRRFSWMAWQVNQEYFYFLLRRCAPVFASVIFWIAYDNQDILLLKYFKEPTSNIGLFAAAMKIVEVLRVLPVLMVGAVFPRLSRAAHHDRADFRHVSKHLAWGLGCAALVVGGGFAYFAQDVLTLVFGVSFAQAKELLRLLIIAFELICINHVLMHLIISTDQEKKLAFASAAACLSNFLFGWWMIPKWGTLGACYALIVSEVIFIAFQGIHVVHLFESHSSSYANP